MATPQRRSTDYSVMVIGAGIEPTNSFSSSDKTSIVQKDAIRNLQTLSPTAPTTGLAHTAVGMSVCASASSPARCAARHADGRGEHGSPGLAS